MKRSDINKKLRIIIGCLLFIGCNQNNDNTGISPVNEIPDFVYAGGETTHFDLTSNAFSTPAPNLSPSDLAQHLEGDLAFEQIFVTKPAKNNPGLGPLFNNNSCIACHIKNGRSLPSLDGDQLSGFLLRISIPGKNQHGGPKPVPFFGGQLQNKSVIGKQKEASFTAIETTKVITFHDGETVILHKPKYTIIDSYRNFPHNALISPRTAPIVAGLGLLEAISEADILANEDIDDKNKDGISGKSNLVWNAENQSMELGRFGWKAESPTLLHQTAEAYHQDMGITSDLFPNENCDGQPICDSHVNEVDLDITQVKLSAFYVQTLAVPAVRNYTETNFLEGQKLFNTAKCNACHKSEFRTQKVDISSLSNQLIFPFTDLLLHDMGDELSDNRPSFLAQGNEWRTPPLWGIGMLDTVNGHSRLLHDGRARNIKEAILWHGGEANDAKNAFINMNKEDREKLIYFINSL